MDKLPDLIEQCRTRLLTEGLEVVSMHLERFGEQPGEDAGLNYGLIRIRFRGDAPQMIQALTALEANREIICHLQEVTLDSGSGEAVLKVVLSGIMNNE